MKSLTRKEEVILLAILNLNEGAYLIAIQDYLKELTGKSVSLTSVHIPLDRMEKNGLLESEYGEATAVRGGRRKKIYSLTKEGKAVLQEYKNLSDLLWKRYNTSNQTG